jgi:hypothetical protein
MTQITELSIVALIRTIQASLVLYHPIKLKMQHIDGLLSLNVTKHNHTQHYNSN